MDFSVSCDPRLRTAFNRAVALLHHMMYEESRQAFEQIAQEAPKRPQSSGCVMQGARAHGSEASGYPRCDSPAVRGTGRPPARYSEAGGRAKSVRNVAGNLAWALSKPAGRGACRPTIGRNRRGPAALQRSSPNCRRRPNGPPWRARGERVRGELIKAAVTIIRVFDGRLPDSHLPRASLPRLPEISGPGGVRPDRRFAIPVRTPDQPSPARRPKAHAGRYSRFRPR